MIRLFMLILFMGICTMGMAQEGLSNMLLEYDVIINNSNKKAQLYIGENKSTFFVINKLDKKLEETEVDGEFGEVNLNIKLSSGKEATRIVLTDKDERSVRSSHYVYNCGDYSEFIVKDTLKSIDWQLEEAKKKIGQFQCRKATARVRGRDYTCWYTVDLPLFFGPWRLHGLPGAIIQASDSEGYVVFLLTNYVYKSCTIPIVLPEMEVVSCQRLMEMKNDEADEIISKIHSRLPRGATFTTTKVTTNYLELDCD